MYLQNHSRKSEDLWALIPTVPVVSDITASPEGSCIHKLKSVLSGSEILCLSKINPNVTESDRFRSSSWIQESATSANNDIYSTSTISRVCDTVCTSRHKLYKPALSTYAFTYFNVWLLTRTVKFARKTKVEAATVDIRIYYSSTGSWRHKRKMVANFKRYTLYNLTYNPKYPAEIRKIITQYLQLSNYVTKYL